MRIFPEMCARTRWPLANSTRNMAFGRGSTTVPSTSMAPSFFGKLVPSPREAARTASTVPGCSLELGNARAEPTAHRPGGGRADAQDTKTSPSQQQRGPGSAGRGGLGERLPPHRRVGGLLTLADEDADAAQGRADRHHRALEAEQQQGLGAD